METRGAIILSLPLAPAVATVACGAEDGLLEPKREDGPNPDSSGQGGAGDCLGACTPGQRQPCGRCGFHVCTAARTWGPCGREGECAPGELTLEGCPPEENRRCEDECHWGHACGCPEGQTQSQACGNCGTQTRTCSSSCQWGNWTACGGEGPCSPGKTESQGCGNCGTQTRTCSNSCTWGNWNSCAGEGVCKPSSAQSCGACKTQTCSNSCQWGSCLGGGVCVPGQTESQQCGDCETATRTCSNSCEWGNWGSCKDEGDCTPGHLEKADCGDCGQKTRKCSDSCEWDAWSACEGGSDDPCDDGLCCTVDSCKESGECANAPKECPDGWSCQESTCECVEGCGQFGEKPQCQGDVLFWCEAGSLHKEDCKAGSRVCAAGAPDYCCAPECTGRECGDDGCGRSCGTCPAAAPTCEDGVCVGAGGGVGGAGGADRGAVETPGGCSGCSAEGARSRSGVGLFVAALGVLLMVQRRRRGGRRRAAGRQGG
ncbi:MAG: hypothetical protein HY744_09140 [Deltaproteobacteria bacterium]|nr:hypothetical protein [Deltaproteobacteria bacterium]